MNKTTTIPDAALASHLAILGRTGAGKSFAARGVVERLLRRGERACIIDPTGVWYGLRLAADGKKASGLPVVIAGGRHGDVPAYAGSGRALARLVGTSSTPLVIDVLAMGTGPRTRFFTDFAEALLVENVGPLHVILDEAHLFAPQTRVPDPQSALMVHAANSLVSLGRARGIRVMLLTQRPAKLHKDALTQVATMVAMQLTAPQDRKAVEAWIGDQADRKQGAEIVASLPGLKRGEGWVWAPEQGVLERVTFPLIETFDSMRAPDSAGAVPILPPIDLAAVRSALAAMEEKPHASPATQRGTTGPKAEEIAAAEQRGFERGRQAGIEEGRREGAALLAEAVADLVRKTEQLRSTVKAVPDRVLVQTAELPAAAPPRRPAAPPMAEKQAANGVSLPPARQRVLDRLAWFRVMGLDPVERARVCVMVGLSPKASTFGVYVSELARDGFVTTPAPGMLALTEAGAAHASTPDIGLGPDALVRAAREQLEPQPQRIFDLLAGAYPASVRRDAVADSLGLSRTASTLGVYLSKLSARGFVENAGRGKVRAADFLFPSSNSADQTAPARS